MSAGATNRRTVLIDEAGSGSLRDLGNYVSRCLPIVLGGVHVFGVFVARRRSNASASVGDVLGWYFVEAGTQELAGELRGDLARAFRRVPMFEAQGNAQLGTAQMREAIGEFDAVVERLAPAFFDGRPPEAADAASFANLSNDLYQTSEGAAMHAAFPEFFGWVCS